MKLTLFKVFKLLSVLSLAMLLNILCRMGGSNPFIYQHRQSFLTHFTTFRSGTDHIVIQANTSIKQHIRPLLTLFTTFRNNTDRVVTQTNTIKNWAQFLPEVQPVLMTSYPDDALTNLSRKYGWQVFPVSESNQEGTPHLKKLFYDVMNYTEHQSTFYGYCNGDILFNEGFLKTLEIVKKHVTNLTTPMLIGRHTEVDLDNMIDPGNFYHWSNITQVRGVLGHIDAIDYFIIANANEFIWDKLKNVVIGRHRYDNYLVAMAINHTISVIDATKTIKAVHQKQKFVHRHRNDRDNDYNLNLIGEHFCYGKGFTSNAPFFTIQDELDNIVLKRRKRGITKC